MRLDDKGAVRRRARRRHRPLVRPRGAARRRVAASKLRPLPLADSDKVRVGDQTLAIGYPLGINRSASASAGIVSGLGRSIDAQNQFSIDKVIQTDAAINPGNSGGPLLDSLGRVIGVNTAILTAGGGGSVGVGFAVPSNTMREVVPRLEAGRRVERAYLGVQTRESQTGPGAYVAGLAGGAPAATAGVRLGDVIVGVGGEHGHDARRHQRRDPEPQARRAGRASQVIRAGEREDAARVARHASRDRAPARPLRARPDMSFAQPVFLVALALVPLARRRVRAPRARAPPRRGRVRGARGARVGRAGHAGLAPPRAARGLRARARRAARRARQAADDRRRPGRARLDHAHDRLLGLDAGDRRRADPAAGRPRRGRALPRRGARHASASASSPSTTPRGSISSPTTDRAPRARRDRDARAQRRHGDRRGARASR